MEEGYGDYDPLSCRAISIVVEGKILKSDEGNLTARCIPSERRFLWESDSIVELMWEDIFSIRATIDAYLAQLTVTLRGGPNDDATVLRFHTLNFYPTIFRRFVNDLISSHEEMESLITVDDKGHGVEEHPIGADLPLESQLVAQEELPKDNLNGHVVEAVNPIEADNPMELPPMLQDFTAYHFEDFEDYADSLHNLFSIEEDFAPLQADFAPSQADFEGINELPPIPEKFSDQDLEGLFI